jgi:hypothetical protein
MDVIRDRSRGRTLICRARPVKGEPGKRCREGEPAPVGHRAVLRAG